MGLWTSSRFGPEAVGPEELQELHPPSDAAPPLAGALQRVWKAFMLRQGVARPVSSAPGCELPVSFASREA